MAPSEKSIRNCGTCNALLKVLFTPSTGHVLTYCPHVIAYHKHGNQTIMDLDSVCVHCGFPMFVYRPLYDDRFMYDFHYCVAQNARDSEKDVTSVKGERAEAIDKAVRAAKGLQERALVGDNINVGKDVSRAESPGQTEPAEILEHVQVALNDALRELKRAEGILRPTFSGTYIREAIMRATEASMWTEKALKDCKT